MCSDGARLNCDALPRYRNTAPCQPSTGAGAYISFSGTIRKHAAAMSRADAMRFDSVRNCATSRQRKNDPRKNRSHDRYGTSIHGTSGMRSSQGA